MHEADEFGIVHDPLEEGAVLALAFGFSREQEIVEADGGSTKSVRLDDVGAGLEILGVDLLDQLRLGELEELEIALEVLRRVTRETLTAELLLGQLVALHHRAHGAVENDDALAQELLERMDGVGLHVGSSKRQQARGGNRQIDAS